MSKQRKRQPTEAELARMSVEELDAWAEEEFDSDTEVPIEVRRNVTISVRFSADEIAELRERADQLGVKVTALIRAAALETVRPVDLATVATAVVELEKRTHELADLVGAHR